MVAPCTLLGSSDELSLGLATSLQSEVESCRRAHLEGTLWGPTEASSGLAEATWLQLKSILSPELPGAWENLIAPKKAWPRRWFSDPSSPALNPEGP